MVPESLSVNGLSSVVGRLFGVMSLFPGVSERSWSRGRVLLARTRGLLLPWLLRATSEQNVQSIEHLRSMVQSHRPGALVTGMNGVTRSVHGPLWCSGWREEGGGVVNVDNPLCPAHQPQIGRRHTSLRLAVGTPASDWPSTGTPPQSKGAGRREGGWRRPAVLPGGRPACVERPGDAMMQH